MKRSCARRSERLFQFNGTQRRDWASILFGTRAKRRLPLIPEEFCIGHGSSTALRFGRSSKRGSSEQKGMDSTYFPFTFRFLPSCLEGFLALFDDTSNVFQGHEHAALLAGHSLEAKFFIPT